MHLFGFIIRILFRFSASYKSPRKRNHIFLNRNKVGILEHKGKESIVNHMALCIIRDLNEY